MCTYLNNNGKLEWPKYPYLNDIGDFWFPLLALLALCPMLFKSCPFFKSPDPEQGDRVPLPKEEHI